MNLQEEIKVVLSNQGTTASEISKKTGLDQALLSRFFSGKVAMSVKSLTKMLDYLGYELTIRRKRRKAANKIA
jgi:transcriptional regulator with XRE-family HTH domain